MPMNTADIIAAAHQRSLELLGKYDSEFVETILAAQIIGLTRSASVGYIRAGQPKPAWKPKPPPKPLDGSNDMAAFEGGGG